MKGGFEKRHIHEAAWANAVNQRTTLGRNGKIETHVEKAVRLIETNGRYTDNQLRRLHTGKSVFVDTCEVATCQLTGQSSMTYLAF